MIAVLHKATGLILSALILLGSSWSPVLIHTCNAQNQSTVYLNKDRIECSSSDNQCCTLYSSEKPAANKYEIVLLQVNCCETSKSTLALEPFTLSQKPDKVVKLKIAHSGYNPGLLSDTYKNSDADYSKMRHQQINNLIPLLIKKQILHHYYNQKLSSEPLII